MVCFQVEFEKKGGGCRRFAEDREVVPEGNVDHQIGDTRIQAACSDVVCRLVRDGPFLFAGGRDLEKFEKAAGPATEVLQLFSVSGHWNIR